MNKAILLGRLTKDPKLKSTTGGNSVCSFTVAVDRRFKDSNGQRQTDFINCVAWRQTATFISQWFKKGSMIAVVGSIQTRSFEDQNGQTRYVTEVIVDETYFAGEKKSGSQEQAAPANALEALAPKKDDKTEGFDDLDLPFEF